eukprot:gb/GECH01010897.1/.p1 GENE.gb/GECH01010897.1/~~gb/GECH01010897.1/.p1  ORF type:complete len:467 (+),score=122.26 gb/GECH01010897.1/:1-1401(+)
MPKERRHKHHVQKYRYHPLTQTHDNVLPSFGKSFHRLHRQKLKGKDLRIWPDKKRNPHLEQILTKTDNPPIFKGNWDKQKCRFLHPNSNRAPYQRRRGELKTVLHWGQRKLLMSEIEFLTEFSDPSVNETVLYAGAAPGTHIVFLATLFPNIRFILVDPADFRLGDDNRVSVVYEKNEHDQESSISTQDNAEPRIKIIPDFFTDDTARRFRGKNVLFISDVRTASWSSMNREEVEEYVRKDNIAQARWHALLQPKRSMLKFRLPYLPGQTQYLAGYIYLPVWGPQTTSETRLVPYKDINEFKCVEKNSREEQQEQEQFNEEEEDEKQTEMTFTDMVQCEPGDNLPIQIYDNTKYGNQMFYFNTRTRSTYYPHNVTGEGIDHCFDCRSEIHILERYIRNVNGFEEQTDGSIHEHVAFMSQQISREITLHGCRTLADTPPLPFEAAPDHSSSKIDLPSIYNTGRIKEE